MNNKIKLSIIIAIYGVEKYIDNFLSSLLPLHNDYIEFIFVDDGCKDLSISILKSHISNHPNLHYQLFSQKNKGLSAARNSGMRLVNGNYFTFLDPDDEVEKNYISEILACIETSDFDILHFNATAIDSNGKHKPLLITDEEGLKIVDDAHLTKVFTRNHWYVWLRIFNKKYLKILKFPEGHTFEDILSLPFCYKLAKKTYNLPKPLIKYLYRQTGITQNKDNLNKNIQSLLYGIGLYKEKSRDFHYFIVFKNLVYIQLNELIKYNQFISYIKFLKQHHNIIESLLKEKSLLTKREIFILEHPILYSLYILQSRIIRFKFLRN